MKKFAEIKQRAEQRKGGSKGLQKLLPKGLSDRQLKALGDDRYLSMMARVINQSGFSWKVIERKWPEFEEAFLGFDTFKLSLLSPEQWEAYTSDRRVVRNWQKIKAVQDNLFFVTEVAREHGSFGRFLAGWPVSDQVGLLDYLKKHGSRLGGNSGQYFLRFIGKDGFVLSRDVVTALRGAGLDIAERPTSKRDLAKVQDAFNRWHEESGLPHAQLSRIAACSVGENYL
jgi:3-methyladenine DNA glycosylase Tag